MKPKLLLSALVVVALVAATTPPPRDRVAVLSVVSDSARAELEAGRFWHAARLLRAEGAAAGTSADLLMLARAEAGWNNWPEVVTLLRDAEWIGTEGAGTGLYLLGRAEEEAGRPERSVAAFLRYLEVAPSASTRYQSALIRAAKAQWGLGRRTEALALMDRPAASVLAKSWLSVALAEDVADSGDVATVEALLARVADTRARDVAWRLRADVLVAARDSLAAAKAFGDLRSATEGSRRGSVTVELGRLVLARSDTVQGRALLMEGLEDAPRAAQARAAGPLMDLRSADRALTLRLAQILDRAGDGRRALIGYDRVVAMSATDGVEVPLWMRIERARLMGTVRSRQEAAVEEFRAIRAATTDSTLGPRNLETWAQLRSRQGLNGQVATLRGWLVEEYPGSAQAGEIVFTRASGADTRGQLDAAIEQYAFIAQNAPTHARAGEGRMRTGQIHLGRQNLKAAVEVYEAYLTDFPDGRRWQEAAYWAGRARLELGDTVAATAHVRRIFAGDPVSYYAVMGADLLGIPFRVDVPVGEASTVPGWLHDGLGRLDLFTEVGFERAATHEISSLTEQAQAQKGDRLSLAEALIERGRTIDGINLAWALRAEGYEWDDRLMRVAFPFPYRELVQREAKEWGLDPFVIAAIIRQESAFKADIVSHAGAVGLMQVMPPTGAELARRHGPSGFHEANLTSPEVNLHLGAAFFVDMSARYKDDLPLVLSAYNAGPTRATRWSRYPEVSDPLRFTERIPFVETRGYVKNVRRNLGLYRALYGLVILGDDQS